MPILGFDIDGVLYPWQIAVYHYLLAYHNYKGEYEDLWDSSDFSGYIASKGNIFIDNLIRIPIFCSCFPPQNRDLVTLHRLASVFDIVYITSRPAEVEFTTRNFFKKYNYPNYDNIIFSNNKILDVRIAGCDYYVEDRPVYCLKLSNITHLIMKRQPWNLSVRDKIENQISSLQELERLLL